MVVPLILMMQMFKALRLYVVNTSNSVLLQFTFDPLGGWLAAGYGPPY
jgi:hypothetical protein